MESYNAILIEQNVSQSERLKQLNAMAISQLRVLQQSNSKLLAEGREVISPKLYKIIETAMSIRRYGISETKESR